MTAEEIQARIDNTKADPRWGYKPASVFVNAPLALIQVEMKAEVAALEWVLSNGQLPDMDCEDCEHVGKVPYCPHPQHVDQELA